MSRRLVAAEDSWPLSPRCGERVGCGSCDFTAELPLHYPLAATPLMSNPDPLPATIDGDVDALLSFVGSVRRVLVLSGAGLSTESGIPDYRDDTGEWKRSPPVHYQEFVRDDSARRRYWARSLAGWRFIGAATPNAGHRALARMERASVVHHVITQNVDRLHQRAGSRNVTDLHGNLEQVRCLDCTHRITRREMQARLEHENPDWTAVTATTAPDGDADLEGADFASFRVPPCPRCRGVLKPTVVFFGENVPRERVASAFARLAEADALLVVGSSLMVFSGYRFVRQAHQVGQPVAVINLGRTRADEEVTLKVEAPCGETLTRLAEALGLV